MVNNPSDSQSSLKNFLEIPYDILEEMNLKAKEKRDQVDPKQQEVEYRKYLEYH